jgi:large subunit ribosomal protein L3
VKALIGKKLGMTNIIKEDGEVVPVTLIQAGPMTVTQVKTTEKDGYNAVQMGYGEAKKTNKPQVNHLKNSKVSPMILEEFRTEDEVAVGDSFNVSVFEEGDKVKVTGTSKGKGFAGTVKKYNFRTSASTHGGNGVVRRLGSIGSMYPQNVWKGKKMPSKVT